MAKSYKQRPDGTYQTTVKARKEDGSIYRKNVSAKSDKELKRLIVKANEDFEKGKTDFESGMTFAQLAEIYFNLYKNNLSKSNFYGYKKAYQKHLEPLLGQMRITEIRSLHGKKIISEMASRGLAKATVKHGILIARQILDVGVENELLVKNVFLKLRVPSNLPKEERRTLTDTEVDLINQTWHKHRMGIPAMIMLYCGLRRGEMSAITWEDIDLKNKTINVDKAISWERNNNQPVIKDPKTKAGIRIVPIPEPLMEVLLTVPANKRSKHYKLCERLDGTTISDTAFRAAWNGYRHMLNIYCGGRVASRSRPKLQVIERFTAHMLRHTYASMLYDAGVDVKTAQYLMGHATLEMTLKIYTHLSSKKKKASIDALNEMLSRQDAERKQHKVIYNAFPSA